MPATIERVSYCETRCEKLRYVRSGVSVMSRGLIHPLERATLTACPREETPILG